MKRSDFQLISIIGIMLGVVLLLGGIYASTYSILSGSPPFLVGSFTLMPHILLSYLVQGLSRYS